VSTGAGKRPRRAASKVRAAEPVRGAVLGADVSRSRSPAIHEAALRALGIGGSYVARSVSARGFRRLVATLAAEGYRYLNVTIPHKPLAAALATSRSAAVRSSGAANTLIFGRARAAGSRSGPSAKRAAAAAAAVRIRAENTDGPGLLAALRDLGAEPTGAIAVVVGSGGAAAGAVEALTAAGARVRIVARRARAARAMRARLPAPRQPRVSVADWNPAALAAALADADMLISAVPAAAWEAPDARAGLDALGAKAIVLEMAYGAGTPLANAVRGRARRYGDGLGMLVHQAAVAVSLALGKKPPLAEMFRAVGVTQPVRT
jgi:shikimate dehydrogenase